MADEETTPESTEETATPETVTEPAPTDWEAEAKKWQALSRKNESTAKQNAEAAKKLKEIEDRDKTETQRLQDQLTEKDVALKGYQVAEVRRKAVTSLGLDSDMAQFITAADEADALEQARILAEKIKPAAAPVPPKADFRQGTRPEPPENQSPDDALRGYLRASRSR